MKGVWCFAKIEPDDAYLQTEVDEAFRELISVSTHQGHHHYTRLQFEFKSALVILQKIMDATLADVPSALGYMDDIIVFSTTTQELFEHLDIIFMRTRDYCFQLK